MFAASIAGSAPALLQASQEASQAPELYNLAVMEYDPTKSWSIQGENNHTIFKDNAADSLFNVSGLLAGIHSNNLAGPMLDTLQTGGLAAQLRDPDNLDFRPKVGSQLEKSGAGAYTGGEYWIPGKQLSTASSPTPPHGAVAVDPSGAQLAWLDAYKATKHTVRLGRSVAELKEVADRSAPLKLEPGTTYFWQVTAMHEQAEHQLHGPIWWFVTAPVETV